MKECKKGDIVRVFGVVDGKKFNMDKYKIMSKDQISCMTNVDEFTGEITPHKYLYFGTCYFVRPAGGPFDSDSDPDYDWWVPQQNIMVEKVEEEKPSKIRWYKNGKLE